MRSIRICHLYPRELGIYADRGNIAVLRARCEWRGIGATVDEFSPGDPVPDCVHDLYYIGGGQDRDQRLVARELAGPIGQRLRAAVADGAVLLGVCGGYQLIGHGYTDRDGNLMPGLGLLDAHTVAGPSRLIGDVAVAAELGGRGELLIGYENHAGRTRLGPGSRPVGRVVAGAGNDGRSGHEGAVSGRVIGTYLHGPLLPKNPWLADLLIAWALEHAQLTADLAPLDDGLAQAARGAARRRAGRRSGDS